MYRPIGTILIASAIGLLTACGGGGGGGGGGGDTATDNYSGSTQRVAVTDRNDAGRVAGDTFVVVENLSFTPRAVASSPLQPPALSDLGNYFMQQKAKVLAREADCPYGGTRDDRSSGDGTAGSTASVTFNNCNYGDLLFTGSMTLTVVSGDMDTTTHTVTMTMDHYKAQELSSAGKPTGNYFEMHGDVTVAERGDTVVVSGDSFYSAYVNATYGVNAESLITDFTQTATVTAYDESHAIDATISSTQIGGSLVIRTTAPFVTGDTDLYPQSGQAVITAANNAKVRLTADGDALGLVDHVTIELDLDGDGTYDPAETRSTYFGRPWYD